MLKTSYLAIPSLVLLTLLTPAAAKAAVDYGSILGGTVVNHQWSNFQLPPGVSPGVAGNAGQWAGTTTPRNLGIVPHDGATPIASTYR